MAKNSEKTNGGSSAINVPYLNAYGNIGRALNKIREAATPDRFTQDFLSTKLGLTGGSAKPLIPFLKRTGFLNSDGSPTNLYKQFRNSSTEGGAAAKALEIGYSALYKINEYAHDLKDLELKGVIVQATGLDANSVTVRAIMGSFKALKNFADFSAAKEAEEIPESEEIEEKSKPPREDGRKISNLKLGYTINLNLPATSDIAVFNAIFKALREHLRDDE